MQKLDRVKRPLSEEQSFSLIVEINKTILAAFTMHLVRHSEKKQNQTAKHQFTVPQIVVNGLRHPVYATFKR